FNLRELRFAQTMTFVINEINRSNSLLPNISIGYRIYDDCGSRLLSMKASMALMNGMDITADDSCTGQAAVQAIIGESESSPTIVLTKTTLPFSIPVISHGATCECLSNRKEYPFFFRTIASDYYQSRALAYLVKHFGWSWVGAVNSDNDYGNNGMAIFLHAAKEEGICVEYSEKFDRSDTARIMKVVDIIKKGTARVVIIFIAQADMNVLIEQLILKNVTGYQMIGVESWITAMNLATPASYNVLIGSIGLDVGKMNIAGFTDYVVKEFWETDFPCYTEGNISENNCRRYEEIIPFKNNNDDIAELRYANNIYSGVYAVAHSLHSLLRCTENQRCEKDKPIKAWQVVESLKKVNFTTKAGENIWFDSTGATAAKYDVVNWQKGFERKNTEKTHEGMIPCKNHEQDISEMRCAKNIYNAGSLHCGMRFTEKQSCDKDKTIQPQQNVGEFLTAGISTTHVWEVVWFDSTRVMAAEYDGLNWREELQLKLLICYDAFVPSEHQFVLNAKHLVKTGERKEISHSATCECLSNRKEYPSFFRTIPSDYYQGRALAYLVKHFGWSWVGAVYSDNDYGNNGIAIFLNSAKEVGICVEYSEKFDRTYPAKMSKVVDMIRKGTAKVIIVFLAYFDMNILIEQLILKNVTGYQMIGVAWISAVDLATPTSYSVMSGAIGFDVGKLKLGSFADYAVNRFWQTALHCLPTDGNDSQIDNYCSKYEDMIQFKNYSKDIPELRVGEHIWFDSTGATAPKYDVLNWQRGVNGEVQLKIVGYYDASLPNGQQFVLNAEDILWAGEKREISFAATCECLSNRKEYPSFFRTIASDYYQGRALAYLVKHFGWSWVGAVYSDNDYGNNGIAIFLKAAKEAGICVEYSEKFDRTYPAKMIKVVDIIKKSTAKVIVVFFTYFDMNILIEQLILNNLTGYQMIGAVWISAAYLATPASYSVLAGAIGFDVGKLKLSSFADYALNGFWQTAHPCLHTEGNVSETGNCSKYVDMIQFKNYSADIPELRYANNVYNAVYAVAHSLHSLLKCTENQSCEKNKTIQPWQVVDSLKKVNFTSKVGENIWFDSTGATAPKYDVVNWQRGVNGEVQLKIVGYYDASLPNGQQFVLNTENIVWAGEKSE
ncbi:extracellular calcium-sensing receptor-like, partial [Clarias magur]